MLKRSNTFVMADKDGDGNLEFDEVRRSPNLTPKALASRAMHQAGCAYVCASWQFVEALPKRAVLNRSYEQLKIIFNMADTDKSGKVSQQEFFTWSLNYAAKSSGAGMVKIFSRYDTNNSGTLDKKEFAQACADMGFDEVAESLWLQLPVEHGAVQYGALSQALSGQAKQGKKHSGEMKSLLVTMTLEDNEVFVIDTSEWAFKGNDPEQARHELVKLLAKHNVELPHLLTQLDDNNNGALDFNEFAQALTQELGFKGPEYVVYEMFDALDDNGNGKVTLAELAKWIRSEGKSTVAAEEERKDYGAAADDVYEWDEGRLRKSLCIIIASKGMRVADIVASWDRDGNGQLDAKEFLARLKALFQNKGMWNDELKKVAQVAFQDMDTGNDGNVSMTELQRWLTGAPQTITKGMPKMQKPGSAIDSANALFTSSKSVVLASAPAPAPPKVGPPKANRKPIVYRDRYYRVPQPPAASARTQLRFESRFPGWIQKELKRRGEEERKGLTPAGAGFSPWAPQPWQEAVPSPTPPSSPSPVSARPLSAGRPSAPSSPTGGLPVRAPHRPASAGGAGQQPRWLLPPASPAKPPPYDWATQLHSRRATDAVSQLARVHRRWANKTNRLASAERLKNPPPITSNH